MSDLPDWTSDYIGIPFKELGRDIDDGVDCWGLCRDIWGRHYDITVPSYTSEYDEINKRKDVISTAIDRGIEEEWVEVQKPKEGDGIVFRMSGKLFHIGVILNEQRFIHVYRGTNTCLGDFTSKRWENRVDGWYRHQSRMK